VTVEHCGWEALTDEQLSKDCALPGGYASGAYSFGWERILARFVAALPGTHADPAGPATNPQGGSHDQGGSR
jgi:hypothetical protein